MGPTEAVEGLRQAAGAWVWDIAADRFYADARFAGLTGLDPVAAQAGLPGGAFYTGVAPEDLLRLKIAVAGVMHGSDAFNREYRVRTADGGVRWVNAKGQVQRDAAGALLRFSGLLTDITEQKRVEEQLRIAQRAGGVGTFEHVEGFGTATVSDQFCRLLGLHSASALPVRTINAVVHPDDPLLIRQSDAAVDDASGYSEMRIRRADTGEERWIARRGEHDRDAIAHGERFIGVIYDITAAKRSEEKLRELTQTLEQRVEQRTRERDRIWTRSRDLFVVIAEGRYTAVNPAWRNLGYSEADLIGRSPGEIVHEDDRPLAAAGYRGLLEGRPIENLDLRIQTKDGGHRWINWTVIPEEEALYAIGRDVTERKELEQQLLQSQKMEAVGQLTGGLAHDFNNMLTGVISGIELARRRLRDGRGEEVGRFLDTAATSAQRAAGLTHRLLAFSRRQTLNPQPLDANALIHAMEELLRRTLGEQVELKVAAAPRLWMTRADANQLESAILNLAINARDAMPEGGGLTIETANMALGGPGAGRGLTGDYVCISVRDSGMGMSEAVRSKVFEPFFTTKPIGQGTGLGLSMVYGFVRQTGGHVQIVSEPGQGTTVKLLLPRTTEAGVRETAPPRREVAENGGGRTVLLVEDEPEVRTLMRSILGDLGYAVIDAASAGEALQILAARDDIAVLVTDVGLPGLNGRQLADQMHTTRPGLPVLFVTGYAAAAFEGGDLPANNMRVLTKPFELEALASALEQMLPPR